MLKSLKISNFRVLVDFRVHKLGRVNLVVGRNNSGKSTVLEALRIYCRLANVDLLDEIGVDHDENVRSVRGGGEAPDPAREIQYQHFFTGRQFPASGGGAISIGSGDGEDFVNLDYVQYLEEVEELPEGEQIIRKRQRRIVSAQQVADDGLDVHDALVVTSSRAERPAWLDVRSAARRPYGRSLPPDPRELPVVYVPTKFLDPDTLAQYWDRIALTDFEGAIVSALRTIDPDVEGLAFRDNDERPRGRRRIPIVKLKNKPDPIPLNSMGDGMLRVLQLALAIFQARGGMLLVDELENGLHYTVQQRIWAFVFDWSKQLNVQVFAATHSWDCIEAFKTVAAERGPDGILFGVGRSALTSDHGKVVATVFDNAALAIASQADLDVR